MNERLTRQELSWLLTQEAKGAADRLRKGVQILTKPPPEPPPRKSDRPPQSERPLTLSSASSSLAGAARGSEEGEGLESTLDMLEGAMQKLSQLYGPATARGRRGRVDVAALLWEIAPNAKVQLAPGAGTEVLSDESELRRMLHVLLGQASQSGVGGAQIITLKRDGTEVRLSVALGPDTAPISPAERAWLSRMAIRFGGRYELEGASEVLIFPADDDQKQEVKTLRKELEAAKAQGEMYARELAAVFSEPTLSERPPPSTIAPSGAGGPLAKLNALTPIARISDAFAEELRAILAPLGALRMKLEGDLEGAPDPVAESLFAQLSDSLVRGADLLSLTRQMARVTSDIAPIPVDLTQIARDEAAQSAIAFGARGVALTHAIAEDAPSIVLHGLPSALRTVVAEMLDRALRAARPGDEVTISTSGRKLRIALSSLETSESRDARKRLTEGPRASLTYLNEIARTHGIQVRTTADAIEAEVPDFEGLI
jgi:hypothetical protein